MKFYSFAYFVTALSCVALAATVEGMQAQNQKIGFIDSEYILSNMPEYTGIDQRLRQVSQEWQQEIDRMQAEIERLKQEFQAREILFTSEQRQQKLTEIDNKIRDRERFLQSKFGPDGDYFKQQQQLLEPIQLRIVEATDKVAARDGFDFVFDRAGDFLFLYTRPQWNISNEVLLEMGIQVDQPAR
ncbi:MAG: OmpH family outer membrane protein [Rhodothermaceae bacterium]|nr:OmpH family outer membrane protein [Rhodothermaceae bacterium]